ncbi:hypothetical protein Tco_1054750 [Tanacetum coccineum]|uniref:Xylulose kinase-1 n=1 Tax=Tanacetum coccineum TaxID=301880 RepID=A0ABQ5H020_9ASTR
MIVGCATEETLPSFGADQFDEDDLKDAKEMSGGISEYARSFKHQQNKNTTHMVSYVKLPMLKKGKDVEVPPTTAKDIQARAREKKARSALLMALPDVDLPKYHLIKDAKGIWDAIKTRYGGNAASKKMQKSVLKQQFEAFSISNSKGSGTKI